MKRRDFIALAGSATPLWTPLARAQQNKVPRLGVFVQGTPDPAIFLKELKEGLRERGYVDGRIPPSLLARADELID